MRRTIIAILVFTALLLIPQVQAQSELGLTWGVTEDTRLWYSVTETSVLTPINETPLVLFESYEGIASFSYLPTLPSTVHSQSNVPYAYGGLSNSTGSITLGILAFPIDNWTLVQELDNQTEYHTIFGDVYKNATYIEDDSVWGRRFNYTSLEPYEYWPDTYMDCNVTVLQVFSKVDGAIMIQQITTDFFSEHFPEYDFGRIVQTAARIESGQSIASLDLLLIIGGVSAVIVVALVGIYWFKFRRSS
ncbi:MAG: hypothetical protein JW779_11845 [Candidatus Thorarchaeota archaeon]|nr:hypothetical protein [Candidatus Thorarchaeota archaeon]